ncbi:MAG: flagellar basal body L-ring protein FlgH [Gammaproteobacteria bacterium]
MLKSRMFDFTGRARRGPWLPVAAAGDRPVWRAAALAATAVAALLLSACAARPITDDFPEEAFPEPPPLTVNDGAIYRVGNDVPLFENATAHRVGDIVTIRLVESTAASKSSSTTTSKKTSVNLPGPTLLGKPVTINGTEIFNNSYAGDNSFDGKGDSAQSNQLTGDITVAVVKRLSNGLLQVRGQKWITINTGKEYVRIQGYIRPIDIQPDNSIESSKVANANISYGGKGAVANAAQPGLLSRFFNSKWMPF